MTIWKRYDTFADWLRDHPPPDLQELVQRFDGFSKVPPREWARFDAAMARWREAYRRRHQEGGETRSP
jgi:hypothetical protein